MVKMRRVEDVDTDAAQAGDYEIYAPNEWNKGEIYFICPKGQRCGVGIRNGKFQDGPPKRWGFDGNMDSPTLQPSINCLPPGCGWHGHIQNGEMKP
jgi:hypothetical protein